VGAIALQPGNSNLILVGTGETNQLWRFYMRAGTLRSTDGEPRGRRILAASSGQSFLGKCGIQQIALQYPQSNLCRDKPAGNLGFDFGLEQDGNSTARGFT